jgi:dTDP-4-dehydrorhamnose reductase
MVWLIGNKGMLGTDVEWELRKSGVDFTGTDKEIDINNLNELFIFANGKGIDWIINCSAYTSVDMAEDESDKAFSVNDTGVGNISRVAKEIGAKLIHISTDYVFDGEKNGYYTEDDDTNPIGVYGKSKLAGELRLKQTLDKYFIIRIAWLYGKHGKNFPYTMLRLFKERDELNIVSDQKGTPTYTRSVAEVISKILKSDSKAYGVYHFTNEGETNWYEFARTILEMGKKYGLIDANKKVNIKPISTEEYPTKAKRPKNSKMSKEKLKRSFNVNILHWRKALEEFIKEIKEGE